MNQSATSRVEDTATGEGPLGGGPIRLVTFDLYDTLVELHPPRWERMATALAKLGITADTAKLHETDWIAETYYTAENALVPIRDRTDAQRETFRREFTRRWLSAAGLPSDPETVVAARVGYLAEFETDATWQTYRVFDEVMPTLAKLRQAGIKRAIISNADADVTAFCHHLAFAQEMDAVITSAVVGWEKPDARTFHATLNHPAIATAAADAIHIGDQPGSDVRGALQIGMRAALIDRYQHQPAIATPPEVTRYTSLLDFAEAVVSHNKVLAGALR